MFIPEAHAVKLLHCIKQNLKGNYCSQLGLGIILRLEILKSKPKQTSTAFPALLSRVFHNGKSKRLGLRFFYTWAFISEEERYVP